MFKIQKKSSQSKARLSILDTPHGALLAPFFMPIATRGAVKFLTSGELQSLGTQIVLSNTYHLSVRPGVSIIKKIGGLHAFMCWKRPILTDSGGYQVFSLTKSRTISKLGVHFKNPTDGKKIFLTPQKVIRIQLAIGSDLMMVLDECQPYPCSKSYAEESLSLTTEWAAKCKNEYTRKTEALTDKQKNQKPQLFGIVQGSVYKDLRIKSARQIVALGFDGYAIGGVSVGERRQQMRKALEWVVPELPENRPRYLMGIGRPEEIIFAVRQGIDMFDCVIPSREARHGRLYVWKNSKSNPFFYTTINITNTKFAHSITPINDSNLKQYSKAYLHHLFKTKEPLGQRLATLNNMDFYEVLMKRIRKSIRSGIL